MFSNNNLNLQHVSELPLVKKVLCLVFFLAEAHSSRGQPSVMSQRA